MSPLSKESENAFRKMIGSEALLIILTFLIAASLLSASTTSQPGLLSIYIGLVLAFFGSLVISMRGFMAEIFGIKSADAEISLVQAFKAMLMASILFILLGLLYQMRALPRW